MFEVLELSVRKCCITLRNHSCAALVASIERVDGNLCFSSCSALLRTTSRTCALRNCVRNTMNVLTRVVIILVIVSLMVREFDCARARGGRRRGKQRKGSNSPRMIQVMSKKQKEYYDNENVIDCVTVVR